MSEDNDPPWHSLSPGTAAERLGTDPVRGLESTEAQRRLTIHGPNELDPDDPVRPWRMLLAQFTAPMVLLLAGAGVLSAALGDVPEAVVIFLVVVLNAWIGFRQEYRAEQAMAALQAMATPTVTVARGGASHEIPAREVVPGDVVHLDAGARVPGDGRLVSAHAVRVEEAALTGESVPVDKHVNAVRRDVPLAERTSMVYAGTSVVAGRATMVTTATGMQAELAADDVLCGVAIAERTAAVAGANQLVAVAEHDRRLVTQANGQWSEAREQTLVATHLRAPLGLLATDPQRPDQTVVDARAHGDLVGAGLAPDLRPPRSNVDDVLSTMNHLAARQQLAVVVAAIDAPHEAIDAPADVDRVVHACLDDARNER